MATINGSTSSSLWTYKLEVTENSYSIENNTSSVTVTAYIGRASSTSYLGGSWSGSITVDGSTQNMSGTIPYPTYINGGGWLELSTKTFSSVPHASDGSKTASVSSSFSSSAFTPSSASASGDVVLTTIPRASTITSVTTANVGSNTTITVDRKSSSFTHTITYTFGSLNGTIATKSSNTSISWTIPNTFYAQMPNDKTKSGTMTITTYSGNTQIGSSSSKTFTVSTSESDCKPIANGSVVDSNSATIAVTGDSSILIAGYSTASVSYTATPRNSASIKKVTVNDETAYSGTSSSAVTGTKPISNFNSNKIDIVATDSRTYPDTKRLVAGTDYTLVPYIPLTFNGNVTRQTPTGDVLLLSFSGNFYSGTLGATTNSLSLVWKYREKSASTWETGGTLVLNTDYTIDTTNNTYSSGSGSSQTAISLGSGFTYSKNYEIQIQYTDALVDNTIVKDGMRGIPIVNWGEDFFNVNGNIKQNNTTIIDSSSNINVNNITNTGTITSAGTITTNNNVISKNSLLIKDANNNTKAKLDKDGLYFDGKNVTKVSLAMIVTNDEQVFTQSASPVTVWGSGFEYGDYTYSTSGGYIEIKNTELCEISGAFGGNDFAWARLEISESNTVIDSYATLVQAAGNGYFFTSLQTAIIRLDPTKTYHLFLTCAPYNVSSFTLNAGFANTSTWIAAKKIK